MLVCTLETTFPTYQILFIFILVIPNLTVIRLRASHTWCFFFVL